MKDPVLFCCDDEKVFASIIDILFHFVEPWTEQGV